MSEIGILSSAIVIKSTIARGRAQVSMWTRNARSMYRVALLFCATLVCSSSLLAQAGLLDPTFGAAGIGIFATDSTMPFNMTATSVAIQNDGKILIAGGVDGFTGVLRLTRDGRFDPTFGLNGKAELVLPFALFGGVGELAVAVATQPDGKILLAISNGGGAGTITLIVARLNLDGSLDTTFGQKDNPSQLGPGGYAVASLVITRTDVSTALVLQPDGKIIVGGTTFMARFDADGQLDPTFGTAGVALLKNAAGAMTLQANGQILALSTLASPSLFNPIRPAPGKFRRQASLVSRYNPDGSLDSNFGIFGQAAITTQAQGLVAQSDGKIVFAGPLADTLFAPPLGITTGFGLFRNNSDGSIDTSFGIQGAVLNNFNKFAASPQFASANAIVLQTDGRLILAGADGDTTSSDFALARYTSDGTLDSTFGAEGQVITKLPGKLSEFVAVALQSDGKIVAVGNSGSLDVFGRFVNNITVARYLGQ